MCLAWFVFAHNRFAYVTPNTIMPIFLSCFSAGSAGSSPTSSQNATLPSSSAWPLSASGYSSSFSSIASAPSIAGTKMAFLLSHFSAFWEKKGPRKCCLWYYSSAAIGRSTLCSPARGRQHFWRLSWGALYGMPGGVLRKMYLFHLMPNAIALCWHSGVLIYFHCNFAEKRSVLQQQSYCQGPTPFQWELMWFFCSQICC